MNKVSDKTYELKAYVMRVVDGDTVEARVEALFDVEMNMTIRLFGINTPELTSKDAKERNRAKQAKARLAELVEGKHLRIVSYKDKEKYGRYLAEVFIPDENGVFVTSVNQLLVNEGLAVAYLV